MSPIQQAMVGALLSNARDMPPEAREMLEGLREPSSPFRYIFWFILQFCAGGLFGAIGGAIGAMFFRKDVPPALGGTYVPPVPPPTDL
jgi:hypothetical protein